jgi:hypothetical protein
MESQQQQQQFLNQFQQQQQEVVAVLNSGKVEFQAIRNTYSTQENLYCYFMIPPTTPFAAGGVITTGGPIVVKPESPSSGDFVGIYKVKKKTITLFLF